MSKVTSDQILLSPGSVTSPSLFGTASGNTGFYFIDANTIGVTVNGIKIGEFNSSGLSMPTKIAIFEDQKTSGTAGGTAIAATWTRRTLQTTVRNDSSFASIDTVTNIGRVTLSAGSYIFTAEMKFHQVNSYKIKIYNTSDSVDVKMGMSGQQGVGISTTHSGTVKSAIYIITSSKTFELQYYVGTSTNTNDLGVATNSGDIEIYARLEIEKVG